MSVHQRPELVFQHDSSSLLRAAFIFAFRAQIPRPQRYDYKRQWRCLEAPERGMGWLHSPKDKGTCSGTREGSSRPQNSAVLPSSPAPALWHRAHRSGCFCYCVPTKNVRLSRQLDIYSWLLPPPLSLEWVIYEQSRVSIP